jgi:hypothetical protein
MSFSGKAGQTVLCEVEAQRIQSRVRPVLKVYDSGNKLLAWSPPQNRLRGDCRVEVKLPADGEYRVQVHDLQYAAASPAYFRLKVGDWAFADCVFPSTIQKGSSAEVRLVGKPGEPSLARLPSDAEGDAVAAPWGNRSAASGPRPAVWLSDFPQLQETPSTQLQELPAVPVSVNGRISKPGEIDVYTLPVQPETELDLEVVADLLGSPIDAELEVRDAKGARLAVADDGAGSPDPRLTFKVPKGVTSIQVAVRDVGGTGGAECIYRLDAALKAPKAAESFALKLVEDSHALRNGKTGVFKVELLREGGFGGPVDLTVSALPEGAVVAGGHVPDHATGALLTLSGKKPFGPAIVTLAGTGGGKTKPVLLGAGSGSRFQPWLDGSVALVGVEDAGPPFSAEWASDAGKRSLVLSGKASLPLRVHRPGGHDGSVRLTLITSQARIFKQAQLDTTRMLREEKPVVVAEDKKIQQLTDALTGAAKPLETAKAVLATATAKGAVTENLNVAVQKAQAAYDVAQKALRDASQKTQSDVEAVLLVPGDLPEITHQVAFKAEMLKRDGKTVEAVAYTPVLELTVRNPLEIFLDGVQPLAIDPKSGVTADISGRVERRESAKGEVTVTLAGLPAGVAVPAPVKLKDGQQDFKFSVKLPPSVPAGPLAGVRVFAQGTPFGTVQVKTREVEVPVTLKAPDSAVPKPPGS